MRKATSKKNLHDCNPCLAKEWHSTKNGDLTPKDVTTGSNKKVWWQCAHGHEWDATIKGRNNGNGCPCCSGLKVFDGNCLQTLNPTLAKEWHPTKNGDLTPRNVTISSNKKVWWQCVKGHEWKTTVNHRSDGQNCPSCNPKTSRFELRVYTEMKYLFHNAEFRKKIHGVECDVFIPDLNLAIEVDGVYYHKDRYDQDKKKTSVLKKRNIDLIRIREKGLLKISSHDILCKTIKVDFSLINILIKNILSLKPDIDQNTRIRIQDYLAKAEFANNDEFLKILNILPSPLPELSLQTLNPTLAKEWHPTKNGNLTPKDVTTSSHTEIWWLCINGHEWKTTVNHRNKGRGCAFCAGKKVYDGNCLQKLNPKLAKEWHPTKNSNLTPKEVTVSSHKEVWWLCSKGHEWKTTIAARNSGNGCPYCAGQRVDDGNCLQTLNHTLAKEWHPTKNGNLTPKDVTTGSKRKVWWQCVKGHEWEATVKDRNSGDGCSCCSGRKVFDGNCLQTLNPALAEDWHPTKNGKLTPKDVTTGSGKKVWWQCLNGHEWEARIADRNKRSGCPYCYHQKRRLKINS